MLERLVKSKKPFKPHKPFQHFKPLYMKITFYGAAGEVTGSCHQVTADNGHMVLFDFGMFQGSDFNEGKNSDPLPFDPKNVDAVLVSHAHLDHTGRIPMLVKLGFKGKIYGTKPTLELAKLIWTDALHIMQNDHEKFQAPILFNEEDIALATAACEGISYGETISVAPGMTAVWHDAGHIFGSSFIELTADGKTVAFSGDLGNVNVPILRDAEQLVAADALLLESTYGDRIHEAKMPRREMIFELLNKGLERGGTLLIPAFSLERTQELLHELHHLSVEEKRLPSVPIYLDSPLAIDAAAVYKKFPDYYDAEALKHLTKGEDFLDFPQLKITRSVDDSKKINNVPGAKVIIAGSGMMNGGRIVHHALRYVSDKNSSILFVGYQAHGTLGRRLLEGAKQVTIMGEKVQVHCSIQAIGALSAHADQNRLVEWVRGAKQLPKTVYLIHGEPIAAEALQKRLEADLKVNVVIPKVGDVVEV